MTMPRDSLGRGRRDRGIQPANPLSTKQRLSAPGPVTDVLILGLLAAAFYIVSLLPSFRLSAIEIQGTERLNPAFVVESVKQTMTESRFGVFPQSSYFYLNPKRLELALRQTLQPIVPVSSVTISKRFPKNLLVQLTESQPAAVVRTETAVFLLDHNGLVTGLGNADDALPYPVISETNALALKVGDQLLRPSVLAALPELRERLEQRNLGPVSFATPAIHCPLATVPEAIREPAPEDPGQNVNTSLATNGNSNRAIGPPALVESACDVRAELARSTELTVMTGEGWRILLDTARPVGETLESLFLALETKLPSRTSLRQVDLRFPPKLFYQ